MIIETGPDFDWDAAFSKLASLPRQAEWEDFMAQFQMAEPGAASSQKWQLMERMFKL
jgi:L-rhamnose mutarotase